MKRKLVAPWHLKDLSVIVLTICKQPTGLLPTVMYNLVAIPIQIVRLSGPSQLSCSIIFSLVLKGLLKICTYFVAFYGEIICHSGIHYLKVLRGSP